MSGASTRKGVERAATAWVALGANLGDAAATLRSAIESLRRLPSTDSLRASPFYRSPSVGGPGPDYVNAVVELRTALEPQALLEALLEIEMAHGRVRSHRNAPRTLDLDLLLFDDRIVQSETLTLPHPRLHERAFVLRPLADLAPGCVIPGKGPLGAWLAAVADQRIDKL
jgi:2-amino-4-hydroxy-6-hydroxymethyldihydropteridine diphosphokinase